MLTLNKSPRFGIAASASGHATFSPGCTVADSGVSCMLEPADAIGREKGGNDCG